MKKVQSVIETTDDPRIWRYARKVTTHRCAWCKSHRGHNRTRPSPSWKDATRARYHWERHYPRKGRYIMKSAEETWSPHPY